MWHSRVLHTLGLIVLAGTAVWAQAETQTGSFPLPGGPKCIGVNPVTNRIYISLPGSPDLIQVFDGSTFTPLIQGGGLSMAPFTGPESIVINPLTNRIYVVCRGGTSGGGVVAINGATNTVVGTMSCGSGSNSTAATINIANNKLYVTNLGNNNVSIFDTTNDVNSTITTVTVGTSPLAIALEPVSGNVYVANSGSNTVSVIGSANTVIATPATVSGPFLLAVNPGSKVYVGGTAASPGNNISIIGGTTLASPNQTLSGTNSVQSIAVNPNTGKVYIATATGSIEILKPDDSILMNINTFAGVGVDLAVNTAANKIYFSYSATSIPAIGIIDGGNETTTSAAVQGSAVTAISVNNVTNRFYVLDNVGNKLLQFDGASLLALPTTPNVNAMTKIAVSSAQNLIFALNGQPSAAGSVSIIDGASSNPLTVLGTAAVGVNSQVLVVNELNKTAYTADFNSNAVTAINFATPASPVATTIAVGSQPTALAVNQTLGRLYVANATMGGPPGSAGTVSVINCATNAVLSTFSVPEGNPALVAVNPVNNNYYVACRGVGNNGGELFVYDANNFRVANPIQLSGNPASIAVDGVANRIFVTFTDSAVLDSIDGTTNFTQSVTGNSVSNNIVAADGNSGRVYLVSPSSNAYRVVNSNSANTAVNSGTLSASSSNYATDLCVNTVTERAYVSLNTNQVAVIDGISGSVATVTIPGGATGNAIAVNPATGRVYVGGAPIRVIDVEKTDFAPPTTTITAPVAFLGALSFDNAPTFTLSGGGALKYYYQVDSTEKSWTAASGSGPFTAPLTSLTPGPHTLFAFAATGSSATLATANNAGSFGRASSIAVGSIASFRFTVHTGNVPTIDPLPPITINEDSGTTTVNLTGISAGPLSGAPVLLVTAVSTNANLIANPIVVSTNLAAGTGSFSFAPVTNANGFVQIIISVKDNSGSSPLSLNTTSVTLNVTVNPVNHAPTFVLGPDVTCSEAPVAQTIANFASGIVFGPANESTQKVKTFIVTAAITDQFLVQPAISTSGTLTFTPSNRSDSATPILVSVQLQDDGGTANGGHDLSAVQTFHITLTTVSDTLIVKNTQDIAPPSMPVQDSLRDCMARARHGDTITFDPVVFALDNSDAATVINVKADLPHLNHGAVTIDASSLRVTVNGAAAGSASGLSFESDGNQVFNLSIINFNSAGISVGPNASNNIIGGNRNTGTGVNGQGLRLAGNGAFGINITGPNATGNVVKGCWIGLDAGGLQSQPNLAGIILQAGAAQNTIGGSTSGEGNVISGNFFEGVTVSGSGSDSNIIVGNIVGASAVTTTTASRGVGSRADDSIGSRSAVANGSAGMFISRGTTSTQAGGSTSGEGNTIANNGGNGVEVRTSNSKKNTVRGNAIGKNKRGGITLFDGSNNGIKAPTISQVMTLTTSADTASRATSTVRVIGTATTTGTIEVFNDSSDQGSLLLGRSSVGSDLTFTTDVAADTTQNITATLTDDSGNTSSFALYSASGTSGGTVTDSDGDGFPDELETALGTDPNSASSTPFTGNAAAGTSKSLSGVTLAAKLNFAKTTLNDSLTFSATLDIGTATLAGQTVVVDVGGIVKSFTLDAKGKSTTKGLTMGKPKNGSTKLILKLTKATLAASLSDEGLTGDADIKTAVSKTVNAIVLFNNGFYAATKTVSYTAKKGLSGSAK